MKKFFIKIFAFSLICFSLYLFADYKKETLSSRYSNVINDQSFFNAAVNPTEMSDQTPQDLSFPNIRLKNIYDNNIFTTSNLKDYDIDRIIVHFWATWCAPCLEEIPLFIDYISSSEKKSLVLLVASKDSVINVKKFLENVELPENVLPLFDESGKIMNLFGTYKLPETYYFDQDLLLTKKFIGPQLWQ